MPRIPADTTLMISMPTMGSVVTRTMETVIALTQEFQQAGLPFALVTEQGPNVTTLRNQLMSTFLSDTRFTHMLNIDSDMSFETDAVWRMLEFGEDYVGCAYPQKYLRWDAFRRLVEEEMARPEAERRSTAELLSRSLIWNHQPGGFDGKPWVPRRRGGFITVPAAGEGLLLLSRKVPEAMVAKGVAPPYPVNSQLPLHKGVDFHDFATHRASADGRQLFGADQSLALRWRECGGEIWMDTESTVEHFGTMSVRGTYSDAIDLQFPRFEEDGDA